MAILFSPYFRAADQSNAPIPGAFLTFYKTGTSTLQPIWSEFTLSIPLANPQQADGNGVFSAIWLDDSLPAYKVVLQYPDVNNPTIPGAIVSGPNGTLDPYNATLSVNSLGQLLFPITPAETAAAVIPANLLFSPALGVDVRRFGVIGNGSSDDTAAMVIAISTGQPLDIANLTVTISSKLVFNQANQHIYARGGSFKYTGIQTTRLADITAAGVEFHGVKFDGNQKQVKGCLLYCASNSARPKFDHCWFTRVTGTHVGGSTSNDSNQQYALMISPYGVEGLSITDCIFDELYNDNSGANGTTPTVGLGFVGGIFFLTDDFASPDTAQTVYTSGTIRGCLFKNIKTVLANGLSISDQVGFQDADGIRFFGSAVGQITLPVLITECTFVDCAKRAVKNSQAFGTQFTNSTIRATSALQYQMITAIKVDGPDQLVSNINIYSPSATPLLVVIQSHDCSDLHVHDINVDRCCQVWSIAPTATSIVLSGWRVSNIRCSEMHVYPGSAIAFGFRSDSLCDHFEDCVFENIDLEVGSGVHALENTFAANTQRMEVTLKGWRVIGGDLKIKGYGYRVKDLYFEINDTAWAPSIAGHCPVEIGQDSGTATDRQSTLDGITVNLKAITAAILDGTHPFVLIYGDNTKVTNLRLTVPEAYAITFAHAQVDGSDFTLDNFEYSGPGFWWVNHYSGSTKVRTTVSKGRRIGAISSTSEFLICYTSEDCSISDIDDYRLTTASSITIQTGTIRATRTYAYIIDTVHSLSSNANVVTDGSTLAHQINVTKF